MAEFDLGCALLGSVSTDVCSNSTGGIIEVKLKKLPSQSLISSTVSITSGVATLSGSALSSWYTWSLVKETAFITDNGEKNVANGSTKFTPSLTIIVNKLRAQIRNEIEVMMNSGFTVWAAVRDANGWCWLMGKDQGLDLVKPQPGSGTARLDRSGYVLEFQGAEGVQMYALGTTAALSLTAYNTLVT